MTTRPNNVIRLLPIIDTYQKSLLDKCPKKYETNKCRKCETNSKNVKQTCRDKRTTLGIQDSISERIRRETSELKQNNHAHYYARFFFFLHTLTVQHINSASYLV